MKDVETALRLVHGMLVDTPYQPGAPWIAALPLTQGEAQKLEGAIRATPDGPYQDPSYEVPLIKLYCRHLRRRLVCARFALSVLGDICSPAVQVRNSVGSPTRLTSALSAGKTTGRLDSLRHLRFLFGGVATRDAAFRRIAA